MATFNGERHLRAQLDSILCQLGLQDELIVADDGSTDGTLAVLLSYGDPRLKLLPGNLRSGPAKAFERAIAASRGDIVFLSDQDDRWRPDKVAVMLRCFAQPGAVAIVSDARVVDDEGKVLLPSYQAFRGSGQGFWRNLAKNSFLGCCMAFRAQAKEFLLPFPAATHMHDEWIGLTCSVAGRVEFIDAPLIDYRRHEGNLTRLRPGSPAFMLKKRSRFFLQVVARLPVLLKWRARQHRLGREPPPLR
jgi:glycosyltransferase involved in cell wall biosynthesis